MFAILSGLGHGSVSRLKQTWEKLPAKYVKMFEVHFLFVTVMDNYQLLNCSFIFHPPVKSLRVLASRNWRKRIDVPYLGVSWWIKKG